MKRIILNLLLVIALSPAFSQVGVPIQVINSAGGGGNVGNNIDVYYNVGEAVITTVSNSNNTITQGFLQPDFIGKFGLSVTPFYSGVTCNNKTDGQIVLTPTISGATNLNGYSFTYCWSPSTVCPDSTCSTLNNLAPGVYSVMVISNYNGGGPPIPNDTALVSNIVITDSDAPCLVNPFGGVTPNGDSHNDFFFIENIDQYPDNVVSIYNRWGQKLDEIKNYDNQNHFWPNPEKGTSAVPPSGTYFYVIEIQGMRPIKGWIELTRK